MAEAYESLWTFDIHSLYYSVSSIPHKVERGLLLTVLSCPGLPAQCDGSSAVRKPAAP
jgi:hypothetical protein